MAKSAKQKAETRRSRRSRSSQRRAQARAGLATDPPARRRAAASAAAAGDSAPPSVVLDRLWSVVMSRRTANPAVSHSARLLSRGTAKVAQKFGEEAVECLIEAVAGNRDAVVAESADVLYHLIVLWVASGIRPDEVWEELKRREGISGIAEKAARAREPAGCVRAGDDENPLTPARGGKGRPAMAVSGLPPYDDSQHLRPHPARRDPQQEGL